MPNAKRIATNSIAGTLCGSALTIASMVVKSRMAAVATMKGIAGRACSVASMAFIIRCSGTLKHPMPMPCLRPMRNAGCAQHIIDYPSWLGERLIGEAERPAPVIGAGNGTYG
jgi:hypothetical protein